MIHNVIGLRTLYDRRQFITVQLEKKNIPRSNSFFFFFFVYVIFVHAQKSIWTWPNWRRQTHKCRRDKNNIGVSEWKYNKIKYFNEMSVTNSECLPHDSRLFAECKSHKNGLPQD